MIRLKNLLNEASGKDVIYVDDNAGGKYLWISYAPGSGTTHPLKDFKSAWLTDTKSRLDPSGAHYNKYMVNDIVKWSNRNKAVLKNKISRIHKVPVYSGVGSGEQRNMSVWGGDINPKGEIYILIAQETDGSYVVNFFKTFNEAKNWLKQQDDSNR
jgi:hypothetical protein